MNKNTRIMVVDDDELYREVLTTMLHEAGLLVMGVEDGEKAIGIAKYSKPDLILLDYKMPGINGVETLEHLKKNPLTKSIPVIMLTGAGSRELVTESTHAGAADFIVKPSDKVTIVSKIHEVLFST